MWLIFVEWAQLALVAAVVASVVVLVVVLAVGLEAVLDALATAEPQSLVPVKMGPLERMSSHCQKRHPEPLLRRRNRRNH
jgi:hypothetical protein